MVRQKSQMAGEVLERYLRSCATLVERRHAKIFGGHCWHPPEWPEDIFIKVGVDCWDRKRLSAFLVDGAAHWVLPASGLAEQVAAHRIEQAINAGIHRVRRVLGTGRFPVLKALGDIAMPASLRSDLQRDLDDDALVLGRRASELADILVMDKAAGSYPGLRFLDPEAASSLQVLRIVALAVSCRAEARSRNAAASAGGL